MQKITFRTTLQRISPCTTTEIIAPASAQRMDSPFGHIVTYKLIVACTHIDKIIAAMPPANDIIAAAGNNVIIPRTVVERVTAPGFRLAGIGNEIAPIVVFIIKMTFFIVELHGRKIAHDRIARLRRLAGFIAIPDDHIEMAFARRCPALTDPLRRQVLRDEIERNVTINLTGIEKKERNLSLTGQERQADFSLLKSKNLSAIVNRVIFASAQTELEHIACPRRTAQVKRACMPAIFLHLERCRLCGRIVIWVEERIGIVPDAKSNSSAIQPEAETRLAGRAIGKIKTIHAQHIVLLALADNM